MCTSKKGGGGQGDEARVTRSAHLLVVSFLYIISCSEAWLASQEEWQRPGGLSDPAIRLVLRVKLGWEEPRTMELANARRKIR